MNMNFDTKYYDYDIVFEDYLAEVQAKYSAIIKPRLPKVEIILKIQCAIEIIANTLDQIEYLVKETFKITFTLSTLMNAIIEINKELLIIFREVKDFFIGMKTIEDTNKHAFDMVRLLSKDIVSFQKSSFLIPEYEKQFLIDSIRKEIPLLKEYLQSEMIDDENITKDMANNFLFTTSVLHILRLNDTFNFLNRLRSLHCEFSFILLHIYTKDDCPRKNVDKTDKTNIPNSYLESLFVRCNELSTAVFERANICRSNYCKSYSKREELIDNYRKKQELQIQQLNNLQMILRIIKELEEKHDTLSGKLIKTTELYSKVHAILEKPWNELQIDAGQVSNKYDLKKKPHDARISILKHSTIR